ncbi:MAG: hypothetical protein PT956_05370 [Firmicutes bacterium]|nr:hypothetical protein [Ezakiella sp.]MDD7762074.1 hypothetical protein [Bacillota bacterium]
MLTFKLIKIKNGFYYYEIYPEGKKEGKGIFVYNPEKDEVKEIVKPEGNFDYLGHFLNCLQDENGNLRESGMSAWY